MLFGALVDTTPITDGRRIRGLQRWLAIWCGLLAMVAACAGSPAAAQTVRLRYGQISSTARSVSSLPLFIAQRNGFFARAGIELDLVPIEGGTDKMVAALDRGEVDVAQTATPYLIAAVLKGSDAVAIAGLTANPIYSLIVKPEIKSFAALTGKTLGLSLAIDTISISTRRLLALHGLKQSDFRVKELVGTPLRFACLRIGECDGVPLGQPEDLIAIGEGYTRLGISSEAVVRFQFEVAAVERSWGEANTDALTRFVGVLAASFRFLRAPANHDAVIATIVESTGSSPEIAGRILALYFAPEKLVLPLQAELDLELHSFLISHSRNRRLVADLENISLLIHSLRLVGYHHDENARRAGQQHLAIVRALLRRDSELAERLLAEHIETSKHNVLGLLLHQQESGNGLPLAVNL